MYEFKVIEAVKSIVSMQRYKANEMGLRLTFEFIGVENPDDWNVYQDGDRFKQILLNLVSNAIKFTQNGSVKIKVS